MLSIHPGARTTDTWGWVGIVQRSPHCQTVMSTSRELSTHWHHRAFSLVGHSSPFRKISPRPNGTQTQEVRLKEPPSIIPRNHCYGQSFPRNDPIISSIVCFCGKEVSFKTHCWLTATKLLWGYRRESLERRVQSTEDRHPKSSPHTLQAPHIFSPGNFSNFARRREDLGIELAALCMSGKHSTSELYAWPFLDQF